MPLDAQPSYDPTQEPSSAEQRAAGRGLPPALTEAQSPTAGGYTDTAPAAPEAAAAMTMAAIRQKFPQYDDLSDDQLAQGLHRKFYADMPFDQFAGKIGYRPPSAEPPPVPTSETGAFTAAPQPTKSATPSPAADQTTAFDEYGRPMPAAPAPDQRGAAIVQAAKEGYQQTPATLSPQAQDILDRSGFGGITRTIDAGMAVSNAAIRGIQETAVQLGEATGHPEAGRDAAGFVEYWMTGQGVPHIPGIARPPGIPEPPEPLRGDVLPPEAPAPRGGLPPGPTGGPTIEGHAEPGQAPLQIAGPRETAEATPVQPKTPEPASDIHAQIEALRDPKNPKDAVFVTAANVPDLPRTNLPGVMEIHRPEGTLLTTDTQKAMAFREAPTLTDAMMADLLGHPETKTEAVASGNPLVVQGTDRQGNVVAETLTSPAKAPEAEAAIAAQAPSVSVVDPEAAQARRADMAVGEAPSEPTPTLGDLAAVARTRRATTPYEALPREPTRLIDFLRRPTVLDPGTINERTIPGGIKDQGGDVMAVLGGNRSRPGLINNATGRNLDNATEMAWEAGYFPSQTERPEINDLLDAIRDDHNNVPRYSGSDLDRADAYNLAVARNQEIDRLAAQHGIDTTGLTQPQFYDEMARRASAADLDQISTAYTEPFSAYMAAARTEDPAFAAMPARSMEDLEREHQQEVAAREARVGAARRAEPESIAPDAGLGEGSAGQDRRGAGGPGGAGAEGTEVGLAQPRRLPAPPAAGPDLFGGNRPAPVQRVPEPLIRADTRQAVMPGMEPSAVQAQASRDQAGRGALLPAKPQEKPNEGLFARPETPQPSLPVEAPRTSRWTVRTDQLHEAPASGHTAASEWVLDQGRQTGFEHIAVIDNATGRVVHAGTDEGRNFISFDPRAITDEPPASITIHHNHPSGSSLSVQDLQVMTAKQISHVVALGHSGEAYIASAGPEIRRIVRQNGIAVAQREIANRQASARGRALGIIEPLWMRGDLSTDEANLATADLTNRFLGVNGTITYMSSYHLPEIVRERFVKSLVASGSSPFHADRSARPVQPASAIASLPRPVGGAPGDQETGPRAATAADTAGAGDAEETQRRLLDYKDALGQQVLHSPVARAVAGLKQARGTGEQMLAQITRTPGVKPEEIRWLGIDDWLKGQKSVTRDQIADFVRANELDVHEVVHGAPIEPPEVAAKRGRLQDLSDAADAIERKGGQLAPAEYDEMRRLSEELMAHPNPWLSAPEARYGEYSLPGGSNYRELLITLPTESRDVTAKIGEAVDFVADKREMTAQQVRDKWPYSDPVEYITLAVELGFDPDWTMPEGSREPYRSAHWDEPNVVAHVRFDERTAPDGKRTLMVHEVQSDWHQAGRKRGYQAAALSHELPANQRLIRPEPEAHPTAWQVFDEHDQPVTPRFWASDEAEATQVAIHRQQGIQRENQPPDAPFKTSWPALAMKRIIKFAADNGMDRVAWAPGEVQAARYDLSKQVSRLDYAPAENVLHAFGPDGRLAQTFRDATPEKLPDIIGKEAAEKLLKAPDRRGPSDLGPARVFKTLEGADLRVGGEGMKAFYDKMLPSEVNKIIGKFGAKVGHGEIIDPAVDNPTGWTSTAVGKSETRIAVHSLDITPRLRHAVQTEGLGLFEEKPPFGEPEEDWRAQLDRELAGRLAPTKPLRQSAFPPPKGGYGPSATRPTLIDQGPPRLPVPPRAAPEGTPGELPLRGGISGSGGPPLPPQEPPEGIFAPPEPPRGPPPTPELEAARIAAPRVTKNLNPVEQLAIFPRTLASLDERSARLYNAWNARETETTTNVDKLRQVIAPTFLKLNRAERKTVAAALEIGRIAPEGLITEPDGTITARNDTVPFARWSTVGDVIRLTPEQTKAANEAVQLGARQWEMLMQGAARRYGWDGGLDTAAIRAAAQRVGDKGGAKKLGRLADLLDVMKGQQEDIYFPMRRFGSYFVAIRPKEGPDVGAGLGGKPPLAWFETVEKPALQELLGTTTGRTTVQALAAKRIVELRKRFPEDRYDVQQGDFARTPDMLRRLDLPAIQKLMMLMENKVEVGIRKQIMGEEGGPTTAAGIRQAASERYESLYGKTVEAFYDALFDELKAGYRKRANVVPGYSADFDRSMGGHMYAIARNSADMVHRDAIESAYQDIQDRHPHRSVANFWKQWREYQENPDGVLTRASNGLSQIGFAWVMGMNPSSTIIMASHTPMMATPVLSVGVGMRPAVTAMTTNLGAAYRGLSVDREHGLTIDLDRVTAGMPPAKRAFVNQMAGEGRLHAVSADDLAKMNERQSQLFGDHADIVRRGMNIATSNVRAVDQANRLAIASAAWDLGSDPTKLNAAATPLMQHDALFRDMVQREGLTPESYARFMLEQATGEWGRQNRPRATRGLGGLFTTLHGFQFRYLSAALRMTKNMGPAGRVAAMFMMGALGLGAGMQGLPFVQDAENAADAIWRHFRGYNPSLGFKLQDMLDDAGFGQIGAETIMRGPLSEAAGVDLGGRIGFGDVLSRAADGATVLGTVPSIMWRSWESAKARLDSGQDAASVAAAVAPFAARGPLRAISEGTQGVQSGAGTPLIEPGAVSAADKARTALGFTPLSVVRAQQERERYYQAQEGLPAVEAKIKAGDTAGAEADLVKMGWSPHRIIPYIRGVLAGPRSVQFQRFQQQRIAPYTPPPGERVSQSP